MGETDTAVMDAEWAWYSRSDCRVGREKTCCGRAVRHRDWGKW